MNDVCKLGPDGHKWMGAIGGDGCHWCGGVMLCECGARKEYYREPGFFFSSKTTDCERCTELQNGAEPLKTEEITYPI